MQWEEEKGEGGTKDGERVLAKRVRLPKGHNQIMNVRAPGPLKGRFLTLRSGLGSAGNWGVIGANGFCILQLSDWAQRVAPEPGSTAGGWREGRHCTG